MEFGEFHEAWRDRVGPTLPPDVMRDLYLSVPDGRGGFDQLSSLTSEDINDLSMIMANALEASMARSASLSKIQFAKHRMIHDRHIVRLMEAEFDDAYHASSVERALFLIYHRIPLIWIFSGFNVAKNKIIDRFSGAGSKRSAEEQIELISGLTTLLLIELNHISRAYSYFDRANDNPEYRIVPPSEALAPIMADMGLKNRNSQISIGKLSDGSDVELF